jgi:hypothetical protein
MITLNHWFKTQCYSVDNLLVNTKKLSQFMSKLEKQSLLRPDNWDRDTYVGAGFECFIEALIKLSPIDKRINIQNYKPHNASDMGVDGVGCGLDGQVHTVQIKYRSNVISTLTANKDHISNFVAHSAMKYGISKDRGYMSIFTTAKNLHEGVNDGMYMSKVRTLGYNELKNFVNDNESFWSNFREALTVK